jgi:long-subunit fatty acid transport protein
MNRIVPCVRTSALSYLVVPRNYKDAYVYRIAGEWVKTPFLPPLTLRAGVLRSISDQPTDTISPSLTDGDSTGFSVGAGFNLTGALRVDAGFQFVVFDKVTATGMETLPGSHSTTVEEFSVGLNWRSDLAFLFGSQRFRIARDRLGYLMVARVTLPRNSTLMPPIAYQ